MFLVSGKGFYTKVWVVGRWRLLVCHPPWFRAPHHGHPAHMNHLELTEENAEWWTRREHLSHQGALLCLKKQIGQNVCACVYVCVAARPWAGPVENHESRQSLVFVSHLLPVRPSQSWRSWHAQRLVSRKPFTLFVSISSVTVLIFFWTEDLMQLFTSEQFFSNSNTHFVANIFLRKYVNQSSQHLIKVSKHLIHFAATKRLSNEGLCQGVWTIADWKSTCAL